MAPLLEKMLYQGFNSGLWFVTLPTQVTVEGERYRDMLHENLFWKLLTPGDVRYIRVLLRSPSSRKVANCLKASAKLPDGTGLPDLKKETISRAFGELYKMAASNAHACAAHDPKAFFGHVKDLFPWAITIPVDTLWEFTYRCLHARDIFKERKLGWRKSQGQPLVEGLDEFRRKFSERYPVQYGNEYFSIPSEQRDKEKFCDIMSIRAGNLALHSTYFPQQLTCAEYDGDGTDRKFWHFQPGYQNYYRPRRPSGPEYADDQPGRSTQQAIAEGFMNEDGDVNPDWEGEELDEEDEEVHGDEEGDAAMENEGEEDEGGDEVEMGGTTNAAPSNLCFRPATHQNH